MLWEGRGVGRNQDSNTIDMILGQYGQCTGLWLWLRSARIVNLDCGLKHDRHAKRGPEIFLDKDQLCGLGPVAVVEEGGEGEEDTL